MTHAMTVYDRANPMELIESMSTGLAVMCNCSPDVGKAMAITCMCENITPIEAQRRYHFVQGKPTMRADAMRAEFRMNHDGDYAILEHTPDKCSIRFTDAKGRELVSSLTWEEAQQEFWPWKKDCGPGTKKTEPSHDTLKDNWATPLGRRSMLLARATSMGLRAGWAELVAGIYTPEEIADAEAIDVEFSVPKEPAKTAHQIMQENAERAQAEATAPPEQPATKAEETEIDAEFQVVENDATADAKPLSRLAKKAFMLLDSFAIDQAWRDKFSQSYNVESIVDLPENVLQKLVDRLEARSREEEPAKN